MLLQKLFIILMMIFITACSKEKPLYEPKPKIDPYESYRLGFEAFEKNQFFFANNKFSEAEIYFDNPELSAKSAIMASFSLYGINFYQQAEDNLIRYLENYPADKYVMYAHYLLAIIYYEQIGDEKNDMQPLLDAKEKIDFFLNKYPDSEYAIDLNLKKNLVRNQFAARELYIAKYYISVQKWIPAINRLKIIVKDYDETIFIEEALHRLVEIYYHIGLEKEAGKYASLLGYNYNTSEWFEQSYKILNKKYKTPIVKKKSKEEKSLFDKIIRMIN